MHLHDVYKKLAEDISYLFSAASETLKFDRTFRAKVIGPATDGKYTISYKNKTLTARCRHKLKPDVMVWVCAPCNDWSSLYIQVFDEGDSL